MGTTALLKIKLTNNIRHLVVGLEAEGSHEPEDELEDVAGRPHEGQGEDEVQDVREIEHEASTEAAAKGVGVGVRGQI